jgi:hypothetical protein
VYTAQYGWAWIPAGAATYDVGGLPCAYLYTPAYGWTWYTSPWGWGPFVYARWVQRPYPFGFHVWLPGPRGWGWQVGPRVNVYVGGGYRGWRGGYGYRHYGYPHHGGHYYGGHHGHWGGHGGRR